MKTLELNQMENVEGGGFLEAIGCLALGATISTVASPLVGLPVGFMCQALLNPSEAR